MKAYKKATIPSSVTSISNNTFRYVTTYVMKPITPPQTSSLSERAKVVAIYVPDESVSAYKAATTWSGFAAMIMPMSEYTG